MPSRYKNSTDLLIYPFYNLSCRNCIRKFPSDGYDYVTIFWLEHKFFSTFGDIFEKVGDFFDGSDDEDDERFNVWNVFSVFCSFYKQLVFYFFNCLCTGTPPIVVFKKIVLRKNFLDTYCLKSFYCNENDYWWWQIVMIDSFVLCDSTEFLWFQISVPVVTQSTMWTRW